MGSRKDHADLIQRLAHDMRPDTIEEMKNYLLTLGPITNKDYDKLDGLHRIVTHLESVAAINISEKDGYKLLIDTFKVINQHALAKQVEDHQDKFCRDGGDLSSRETKSTTGEQPAREQPESREAAGEVEEYKRKLTTKENDYRQLQEKLTTKENDYRQLQEKLTTKENDNRQLQEKLTTKENDNRQLQEKLTTKENDYRQLQEKLTTKENDNRQLQEKLTTKENDYRQLQEKLATKENDHRQLQEKLTTKENDNKQLQVELDTTKKKFQEQVQEGGVQGAVGGTANIQRYEGQEGVQLAKGPRDIERCREVHVPIKEYGAILKSIVNLGDRFAVAYGPSWYEIKGVDIYNISGVKQKTLKDNIKGLRDLAVTPDKGTLVAVCDEGSLGPYTTMYTIRQFDPVRGGFVTSTPQFKVDGRVWGFDVCDGQQFVILHSGLDKVTFVDEDGSVVLTDTEEVKSHSHSISCGGRHVFISRGQQYVDVYEITEDRHLKHIATSQHFDLVSDVSATADGEVTVACQRGRRGCLGRATFKDNKFSEWKYKDVDSRDQALVSVGGDHVVVVGRDNNDMFGRKTETILRVFKEEAV